MSGRMSFWTTVRVAGLGVMLGVGTMGCHKTSAQDVGAADAGDPANANFAPVTGVDAVYAPAGQPAGQVQPARVLAQRSVNDAQQQAQDFTPQQGAPIERRAPGGADYANTPPQGYDTGEAQGTYDPNGGVSASDQAADEYAADLTQEAASEPPPPLPQYDQPPCPDPDDLWTPGYWGWGSAGYYWVPGVWVAAPYAGALWTPGYWGFVGGRYRFHHGFWGPHIGFYGGINYGFGYTGYGYYGGYWRDRHFVYNTAVNRVNVNVIRNVYVRNVVVNNVVLNDRVSYNGGRGGVEIRPRPTEMAVLREQRIPPMQAQLAVRQEAQGNRSQFYSENHGRPQTVVVARPVQADRTLPPALPRAAAPVAGSGFRQADVRPGQPATVPNPAVRGGFGQAGFGGRPDGQRPAEVDDRQFGRNRQPQPGSIVQPAAPVQQDQARGRGYQQGATAPQPNVQAAPQPVVQPPAQARPNYQGQPAAPGNPQQGNYHRGPAQPYDRPDAPGTSQYRPNDPGRGGQPGAGQQRFDNRAAPAVQPAPTPPVDQPRQRYQPPVQQVAPQAQPQPQVQQQRPQPQPQVDQPRQRYQPPVQQVAPQAQPEPRGQQQRPQPQPQVDQPRQRYQPPVQQVGPQPQPQVQQQRTQPQPQMRPAPPPPRAEGQHEERPR